MGHAGEPLAVALLAHGVRAFRVMTGSGETRGGFCMIGRCADCLMTVDGVANVRACVTPLRAGLVASSLVDFAAQPASKLESDGGASAP
jgi:hypothetical protein